MISRVAFKILTASKPNILANSCKLMQFSVFKKRSKDTILPSKTHKNHAQPTSQHQQMQLQPQQSLEPSTNDALRREIVASKASLPVLLALREQVFRYEPSTIPFYLSFITDHISAQNYNQHESAFEFINEELNNYSQQLEMSPVECLTMLRYREQSRQFEKGYSFTANFGFQRKATLVCASLIHKRELELNQIIYTLEGLLKLGSMSVLLFMNFVKYIKGVFSQRSSEVTLLHLVTILNTNLLKRNQITLENILYDQVLNHMLVHLHTYLRNETIEMKVQVLGLLLVFDSKKYYKINKLTKQLWVKRIFSQVDKQVEGDWARKLFALEEDQEGKLNWRHVLHLVECINFTRENRLEQECYIQQFDSFLGKAHKQLLLSAQQCLSNPSGIQSLDRKPKNIDQLFRLLFSPSLIRRWVQPNSLSTVYPLLCKLTATSEATYFPLVDTFNQLKHSKKDPLTKEVFKILKGLYLSAKNNNLVVWALAAQMIDFITAKQGLKVISELGTLQFGDQPHQQSVLSYILLVQYFAKQNNLADFKAPASLLKLFEENLQTPKTFVNRFHATINSFRNPALALNSLQSLAENCGTLSNYLQEIKTTRHLAGQTFQILELVMVTMCNNGGKKQELFAKVLEQLLKDDIMRHQYLAEIFPERFPMPTQYHKRANILSSPQTFRQNFEVILAQFSSTKYSYFLWDLMIKSYVKLPTKTREQCYPLLQQVFAKAYEHDNLRKIILLMVFTNHVSSGIIVAPKAQLRSFFESCIDKLIQAEEIIEYHYQCYLQILINAISSDILSLDYLHKIKDHSLDKSPDLKNSTTLMLLTGGTFKAAGKFEDDPQLSEMINNQTNYLRYLAKNKRFTFKTVGYSDRGSEQSSKEGEHSITGKVIAIYLRFQLKEILELSDIVFRFLQENNDFAEWLLVAYSFKPGSNGCSQSVEERQFYKKLGAVLLRKLVIYKQLGMLSVEHEADIMKNLSIS